MPHPPFIILDESSKMPLYRQIYETLRRSILSGEFHAGRQLPASRDLAKQLGISRMTVLNAYDQLTAEGYLESKVGAGTFVANHLPEEFLSAPKIERPKEEPEIAARKLKFTDYGKRIFKNSREILFYNRATPPIPFQHGLAAIDKFPFHVWTKLANKSYRTLKRQNFGYGEPAGFYPLREAIAAHLKSVRAVNCLPEQVIITSSAQQAFDFIGRIFLESDAEILAENPCYFGVKQAFKTFDAKFIPISVDEDGFDVAAAVKKSKKAKLAYVTPSHQFPLGITMSLARRMQLLEWAQATDAFIIEDDYDSEFRYTNRPLPSLQGLDRYNRVLYVGTFSKTMFPSLRLGCIVVPPDLIEIFTSLRAVSGSQSPMVEQATLAEFISEGHFSRHIRRMRRLYESRQEILVSEIKKHLAGKLEVKNLVAGMHIVGWLPDGITDKSVAERAAEVGIKLGTISSHLLTEEKRDGLILGYTAINEKQIKKGVRQLGEILEDLLKK